MLPSSFPSYIYFLTVLVALILIALINKKKDITPWSYREILYFFTFWVFCFCVNFFFSTKVSKISLWRLFWDISKFQFLYFLPLLYVFFVLAKRKPKNIYFTIRNKSDILLGVLIGVIIGVPFFLIVIINKDLFYINRIFYPSRGNFLFYFNLPLISIIGPLTEEIIFRGILIPTFEERMKTGYALIISTILFGLMHGSFYQIIISVFVGFLFGWLFIKRRTIIPGFIAHSILNFSYSFAIHLVS